MNKKLIWFTNAVNQIKGNKILSTESLDENTLLATLELDSLDVVELQMMYEDEFNYVLGEPTSPIITVGDLLSLIPEIS